MQPAQNQMVLFPISLTQIDELIYSAVTKALSALPAVKQQHSSDPDLPLTREQAAAKLSINKDTLSRHTKAGRIKSYNFGRKVYYKSSEIDAALVGNIYKGK